MTVPGTFKNREPEGEDIESLDADQLLAAIRNETLLWDKAGLNTNNVNHSIFNMDASLMTIIEVMKTDLGIDEDRLTLIYRRCILKKLREVRNRVVKKTILAGVPGVPQE